MTDSDFHPSPIVRLLNTSWPLFRAFRVDVRVSFEVQLERTGEKGRVRVVQKGRAPKSYEVDLPAGTQ